MSRSLDHTPATLPSRWYVEQAQLEREWAAIWRHEWVCVGRADEWAGDGAWRAVTVGDQRLLVVRDAGGELRAFHNTCRHRGAALCTGTAGRFTTGRIVCPYHAWAYALDGQLVATPRRIPVASFDSSDHPLYAVSCAQWGGWVFVNIDPEPAQGLVEALGADAEGISSWPLAELRSAHREEHEIAANWKVFWENYMECAHCPGVHPGLCRAVPVYAKGLLRLDDDPSYRGAEGEELDACLAPDVETWSVDGHLQSPPLPGVEPAAVATGMRFATFLPGMYIVAHRDYVRSVRIEPLAAERSRLTIEWFVHRDVPREAVDVQQLTAFARQVVLEDARVCELTQAGLRSVRHEAGVLMPQEYEVYDFQNWVRERVGTGR